MTRRVFVVESRGPGGEWVTFLAKERRSDAERIAESWRADRNCARNGVEWRVVEYVPRDESGG